MKVLVTGAAGFIGSALSIRLLDKGDKILGHLVYASSSSAYGSNTNMTFRIFQINYRLYDIVRTSSAECSHV